MKTAETSPAAPTPVIEFETETPASELTEKFVLIEREALAAIRKLAEEKGFLAELQALNIEVHSLTSC